MDVFLRGVLLQAQRNLVVLVDIRVRRHADAAQVYERQQDLAIVHQTREPFHSFLFTLIPKLYPIVGLGHHYDGGVVDLFPEYDLDTLQIDGETVSSFQRVSYAEVALSLTCDPEKMKNMDMKLFRIRGIFNYMLNDMEKLNLFIKGKLFKPENVYPFIDYYIDIISGENRNFHDDPHVVELRKYIVAFDFEEAQELIERLHPHAFKGIKRP